jgi:hypothetical protein
MQEVDGADRDQQADHLHREVRGDLPPRRRWRGEGPPAVEQVAVDRAGDEPAGRRDRIRHSHRQQGQVHRQREERVARPDDDEPAELLRDL